jgi:hypothetical protein
MRIPLLLLALCSLPACLIPPGNPPQVALALDAATQYNHRGMPQNATGVLQPSAAITLPAIDDGLMTLSTWGNMDLQDDVGDAWYPDGNALRFSEIDYIATYSKRYGQVDARYGIHNYNIPRGDRFPFGARGATVELFGHAEYDLQNTWFPFAELRVDIDEAEGWYAFAGCAKSLPINEKLWFEAEAYASYMDSQQGFWNYALTEAGLADARLTTKLNYQYDDATQLRALLAFSTIIDSKYRDEFDDDGIDTENVWLSLGVTWSY